MTRAHRVEHVRERLGVGEVEHVLAARRQRRPGHRAEHPLGVGAHDVGVEVDHLGLEPQAELHAEALDVVDEGAEPLGPDVGGDLPVAQAAVVVAATAEPAVVEHEPLDADRRRRVGQPPQVVEVGGEVDRLPGVEHERPRAGAGSRAGRAGGARASGSARRAPRSSARRRPAARCRSRRAPAAPRPAPSASPPPSTAACGPAPSGSRSTRCSWLPLHATCVAHTSPDRKPKPAVPATMSSVASWPVRPRRPVRSQVPSASGRRCGERSRHQRPVRSSTSSARAGSGSTARSAPTSSGVSSSEVLVSAARRRARRARRAGSAPPPRHPRRMPSRAPPPSPSPREAGDPARGGAAAGPVRGVPGVPSQPSPEVGSTLSAHGTSSWFCATGRP